MESPALRPLSTGEVLDVAFALYRRHFAPLATIAVAVQGFPLLLQIYVEGQGGFTANLTMYALSLLLGTIAAAIGMGASMQIIAEGYLGREIGAREALARAVPFAGRLVVLSLAAGFLVGFGFVLLIVPGIIVACGLGVAAQALVLERISSPGGAMSRSWALTRGFRVKVFFTFFVVVLLIYLASAAAAFFAGLLVGWLGWEGGYLVVMMVLWGLFSVLVYPYLYSAATVLYYDLRVRKEGFDLEMLEQAIPAA
jgi:hypothetical protein